MSPVLVTGATGFMGRHLVSRLLADGRAVRVLERRPSDAFDGLAVERVTGDVTQPETLAAACAGAESVFNLAGVLSYDAKDEARLQAVNVDGLQSLLSAARQAGSGRVVQVSSVAAVGYTDDPARPQNEDSAFPEGAWRNRYARTKRLGEQVVERAVAEGQDVVMVCPGFLLGPGDDGPTVDPDRFLGADHPAFPGHWASPPRSWEGTPEQELLAGETRERVQDAIDMLPASQRAVISLRDVEGWSSQEVCDLLAISEGNQRVLLHRARAKVREALEEYLDGRAA